MISRHRRKPAEEAAERDPDRVDKELVDEAIGWIREKMRETVSRGMVEIGDYVFEKFFKGDVELLQSRAPNKSASFASLCERCETSEINLSRSVLHRAVATAAMRRSLPEGSKAFPLLPPTHQAALLPLREPQKVERLAQKVLAKNMSVRELKELVGGEVAKQKDDTSRRGRPPKPLVLKALDASLNAFKQESGKHVFTKAQVDGLTEEQSAEAIKGAQTLLASLEKLLERLRAREAE